MKKTILFIGDENEAYLEFLVAAGHYTVVMKPSAQEALGFLRAHTPELIVINSELPDMRGADVCYRVKKVSRLHHVPVIMILPAENAQRYELEAKIAKADTTMQQPLSGTDFRNGVLGLLSKKPKVA